MKTEETEIEKSNQTMNTNLVGSCYVLNAWPTWATALGMYMIVQGVLFVLRDKCEGLYYNTSYSAVLGDGALVVVVLMAAEILKRGMLPPGGREWMSNEQYHVFAAIVGAVIGLAWFAFDCPKQLGDRYHHLFIAPLLVYLGLTLLPVIFKNGTKWEIGATVCLIALWTVLCVYDLKKGRLDQRNYRDLGEHLDAIKHGQHFIYKGR